jgi:hypothetical protein
LGKGKNLKKPRKKPGFPRFKGENGEPKNPFPPGPGYPFFLRFGGPNRVPLNRLKRFSNVPGTPG